MRAVTLHTHDMPRPNHHSTHLFTFADDVSVLTTGRNLHLPRNIQAFLDRLAEYEDPWRIKTNPQKTSLTYFGAPDSNLHNYNIHIKAYGDGQHPERTRLEPQRQTKTLGVNFDKYLKYTTHNTALINRPKLALKLLFRFGNAPPQTILQLYKALVKATLTFSPLTLLVAPKTTQLKAQTIQNKALRLATRAPRYTRAKRTHDDTNTPPDQHFCI